MPHWSTHTCCDACWEGFATEREPVRVRWPVVHTCCYCGASTRSGIFTRDHEDNTPHCKCRLPPIAPDDLLAAMQPYKPKP